jgi:GNAT superfamily N-acetyltransferase
VLAVQRAAYAVEARLMGLDGLPPARETLAELQACGEELWLCEEDGRLVVGLEDARGALVIARLFVAPEAMRRGVGRALVRRAVARADGRPVRTGTGAANAPALALYTQLGFRRTGEREVAPGVGYVELVRE